MFRHRHRCNRRGSKCRCHVLGHWRAVHWSCLCGGVGVSAPTSISTTVRRDPYRVTTKLEPDTSFGSVLWHPPTSHADRNRSPCWGSTKNSGRFWADATQFEPNPTSVNTLLSSMTVFMDSIQVASLSPSRTKHLCTCTFHPMLLHVFRTLTATSPSLHSDPRMSNKAGHHDLVLSYRAA